MTTVQDPPGCNSGGVTAPTVSIWQPAPPNAPESISEALKRHKRKVKDAESRERFNQTRLKDQGVNDPELELKKTGRGQTILAAVDAAAAAVHVPTSVQTFLIFTITGLIFCWLLYKTQRLWTCILARMTYNAPAALLLML